MAAQNNTQIVQVKNDWRELIRISNRQSVPMEDGAGLPHLRNFKMLGTKLYPLPIETRTEDIAVRVFYFKRDESPVGQVDLENAWMREFPDLFIAEVGLRLAADLEDDGALRYFSRMVEEARENYDNKVEEEEHAAEVLSF